MIGFISPVTHSSSSHATHTCFILGCSYSHWRRTVAATCGDGRLTVENRIDPTSDTVCYSCSGFSRLYLLPPCARYVLRLVVARIPCGYCCFVWPQTTVGHHASGLIRTRGRMHGEQPTGSNLIGILIIWNSLIDQTRSLLRHCLGENSPTCCCAITPPVWHVSLAVTGRKMPGKRLRFKLKTSLERFGRNDDITISLHFLPAVKL
ncbi:hypothetical protein BaRGS_00032951 [Batillaria attramentaria]|uniref:Uncharacterized protein n=1 Tax=Batillaria attramentaria TaxID=370345 RepID=A0ABD0JLF7_9CAEN